MKDFGFGREAEKNVCVFERICTVQERKLSNLNVQYGKSSQFCGERQK